MEFLGKGTLYIRAFTAGDALPTEGVLVRIKGANEENRLVEYSLLTDKNGLTERVTLPAPEKKYSTSPSPDEQPYAIYDVEVFGGGFYRKRFFNVTVFDGTDSYQPVAMIPISNYLQDGIYPSGNLNVVIEENEFL
ncbi:MAG: hypothetical protein IKB38_02185 [Clostridia bacterium]|nr:hypothetical protein [Clostridia bacterium]